MAMVESGRLEMGKAELAKLPTAKVTPVSVFGGLKYK